MIFDPFAGCGTTLVSAQKLGINAVGNEGQEFMFDVISAKLGWDIDSLVVEHHKDEVFKYVSKNALHFKVEDANPLLLTSI